MSGPCCESLRKRMGSPFASRLCSHARIAIQTRMAPLFGNGPQITVMLKWTIAQVREDAKQIGSFLFSFHFAQAMYIDTLLFVVSAYALRAVPAKNASGKVS